jgi:NADPH-dependent curcumin reductase CurA
MTTKINRQWRLAARPEGFVKNSDFHWTEEPAASPGEGEVLIRNLYLSLDPTNRGWMNETPTYLPPIALGDVIRGVTIGMVEESRNPNFPEGSHVQGLLGWQDYAVSNGAGLTPLPANSGIPIPAFFAVFGHIGMTAYFGLLDVGKPRSGETLVVSAAAGATGSLVGQIGKIKGCRVVGIAGGAKKCRWITEELGFDAAIDYKAGSVLDGLKQHCPDGVDIDFENVGGEILDAVLSVINFKARIVLCGLISQYNAERPAPGPSNFTNILLKSARVEGFIVLNYTDRAQEAFADLGKWMAEGRLKYKVDIVEGLEQAPHALNMLFEGTNQGKLIVKI